MPPILLLLALALRLPALDQVPPGLFGDEAANGVDALDTLAGNIRLFYPGNFGREGLHIWLVAIALSLFGVHVVAVRLPSALLGSISVATTSLLGASLWPDRRGRLIGLLAALWMGTSFWHLHLSRFSERLILTPVIIGLSVWLFWRAYRRDAISAWLLAGLALGLNLHAYSAGRFFPLVFLLFWLTELPRSRWSRQMRSLLPFIGGALLSASPMLLYFATHPQHFFLRARAVGVFWEADSLQRILRSIWGNLGQFVTRGDADWFFNLSGRPVFNPITVLFALGGLAICLRRWRRPAERFLLLWLLVMFLPAVLATDKVPSSPRIVGMLPALYLLPALALVEGSAYLRRRWKLPRVVWLAMLTIPLLVHASIDLPAFFNDYPQRPEVEDAFEADAVALSEWLTTESPAEGETIYISLDLYRHPVTMFLAARAPTSAYFTTTMPGDARWLDARHAVPVAAGDTLAAGNSARPPAVLVGWLTGHPETVAEGEPLAVWRVIDDLPFIPLAPEQLLPSLVLDGFALIEDAGEGPILLLRWQVMDGPLPDARAVTLQLGEREQPLGVRPMEWRTGDHWASWLRLTSLDEARGVLLLRLMDDTGEMLGTAEIRLTP